MSLPFEYELTHKYGGNGWVLLRECENEWSEIAALNPNGEIRRSCWAWTRCLSVSTRNIAPVGLAAQLVPIPVPPSKELQNRREQAARATLEEHQNP